MVLEGGKNMVKCGKCGRHIKSFETKKYLYSPDGTHLLCCNECWEKKPQEHHE